MTPIDGEHIEAKEPPPGVYQWVNATKFQLDGILVNG